MGTTNNIGKVITDQEIWDTWNSIALYEPECSPMQHVIRVADIVRCSKSVIIEAMTRHPDCKIIPLTDVFQESRELTPYEDQLAHIAVCMDKAFGGETK